jgi:purine-nucleoside phosphorylase
LERLSLTASSSPIQPAANGYVHADYVTAAETIRAQITITPTVGLILGSGLGSIADSVQDAVRIETHTIPGWPRSTVEGHKGQLVIGHLDGQPVCVLQGRAHFYEGNTMAQSTFSVRVMKLLGVQTLIVTNAAGGLNTGFAAGDLMMITDHINMPGMVGFNPLIGTNDAEFGPRFPGMTVPYDRALSALARKVAAAEGLTLREGVYVCLSGPNYETPAEVRMLRSWADAVGMSTAPEVVIARHAGLRVLGFSGISNVCLDSIEATAETNHAEVMDVGARLIVPALVKLLRGVLNGLSSVPMTAHN